MFVRTPPATYAKVTVDPTLGIINDTKFKVTVVSKIIENVILKKLELNNTYNLYLIKRI
jgi:hypothetical protein